MNLDKINSGENPDNINVIIEISAGSNIQYEMDKESGVMILHRVIHSSLVYPTNYGFVNQTLSQDGKPADILLITDYPIVPQCIVKCRLIGVLIMEDENGLDEKLLAVPISQLDPSYDEIQDISDVPKHTLSKIKNFFETHKMLEPNRWVKVKDYQDKVSAAQILRDAIENYNKSK